MLMMLIGDTPTLSFQMSVSWAQKCVSEACAHFHEVVISRMFYTGEIVSNLVHTLELLRAECGLVFAIRAEIEKLIELLLCSRTVWSIPGIVQN